MGETRIATKRREEDNRVNLGEESQQIYYYHGDHLGSAQLVTDYQGKTYEQLEYTPYGELWVEHVPITGGTPFRFTGKERDGETGLYYFGARYLNPQTSMWLSADPAMGEYVPQAPVNDEAKKHNKELPGLGGVFNYVNLHAYHYAGNNPVKLTDPDGKIFVESPEMKKNKDPNNERGYKINVSFYASAKIFVQLLPAVDRSRSESGIQGDKGEMSLVENFPSADVWLLGNPERRGPVVDRLGFSQK